MLFLDFIILHKINKVSFPYDINLFLLLYLLMENIYYIRKNDLKNSYFPVIRRIILIIYDMTEYTLFYPGNRLTAGKTECIIAGIIAKTSCIFNSITPRVIHKHSKIIKLVILDRYHFLLTYTGTR